MNTLHMLLRALGACLLIVIGSMVSNAAAWLLIVIFVLLPVMAWRWIRRRGNRG